MTTYRSLYANHVHQLSVAVSKHFYAGKDGLIKYQKEPFKISLNALHEAKKRYLVIYSLRDHASGVFYIEVAFVPSLISIQDFLYRAWQPKSNLALQGLPEVVLLPKTAATTFPELEPLLESLNINVIQASSGFQSGAPISTKALEGQLAFYIGQPIEFAERATLQACQFNDSSKGRTKTETKAEMWHRSSQCRDELMKAGSD